MRITYNKVKGKDLANFSSTTSNTKPNLYIGDCDTSYVVTKLCHTAVQLTLHKRKAICATNEKGR